MSNGWRQPPSSSSAALRLEARGEEWLLAATLLSSLLSSLLSTLLSEVLAATLLVPKSHRSKSMTVTGYTPRQLTLTRRAREICYATRTYAPPRSACDFLVSEASRVVVV